MSRRNLNGYVSTNWGGGNYTYDEYFGLIPPESTSFQFPLYITVPFTETVNVFRKYHREVDNISSSLKEWFLANAVVEEGMLETYYTVYNPNIYINGRKCEYMESCSSLGMMSDIYCFGIDNECYIDSNNNIEINIELG